MHTETSTIIRAPLGDVYELAAGVECWPDFLPHYRYVRVSDLHRGRRVVEMAASRDAIPVWWVAVQECFPDVPEVSYRHVRGITKGMAVTWSFALTPRGVLVNVRHDLRLDWPLIGSFVADQIIGPLFVDAIARRTLNLVKARAEMAHGERQRKARNPAGTARDVERLYGQAG